MIHLTDSFPGRIITDRNKTYRYFGGTAYLGLATLPDFKNILIQNMERYGTGYAASRKANVQLSIYANAEAFLADFAGSEAALSVSSGFLAGQLVLQAFPEDNHHFFCAPDTHPALLHPNTKKADSYTQLLDDVNTFVSSHPDKNAVVLCDSITTKQNLYENNWYNKLPMKQTIFVADDSHGLGVMGDRGTGIFKKLSRVSFKDLVVCGSLSKGFGIQAGAIFTSKDIAQKLSGNPVFAGASPASPAMLATFMDASSLYDEQREKLKKNILTFNQSITDTGYFNFITGHPAYIYQDRSLTDYLLDKGIITTAFHYPDQQSPLVQRIVLSAHHTGEDISLLSQHLLSFFAGQQ